MSKSIRWIVVTTLALVTSMAFTAGALAAAPKFHAATSSVNNAGALVVNFDERGLGNENVDYTLTADASATYACINRGGNHPEAANKETFNADVSASGSFEVKNGRVVASHSARPISAGTSPVRGPAAGARRGLVHEHRTL